MIKAVRGNTRPVYRGVDYTGRVFGNYKVLGPITCDRYPVGRGYRTKWLSQCSCGSEPRWVTKENLIRGLTKGCPECAGKRNSKENNGNWKGFGRISGHRFYRVLYGAKSRGISVEVTLQDLDRLWGECGQVCALTNLPIDIDTTASLDRIDSKKGYELGNLQWVHKDINKIKNDVAQDRFIELCSLVAQKHKGLS